MPKDTPLITACIPTYRRPQMLKRAIRSVQTQTFPNYQICVFDNASGDETAQMVAELAASDPRIKYVCHEENIGMVGNFNYALTHVDTPYFSLLCDDDVLLPNFYELALAGFEKYPDAIFVGGSTVQIDADYKVSYPATYSWKDELYVEPPQGFVQMMQRNYPVITSILYRKEVVAALGLFDAEVPMMFDIDYALRLSPRFAFVMLPQLCAIFKPHANSTSMLGAVPMLLHDFPQVLAKLAKDETIPADIRKMGVAAVTKEFGNVTFRGGIVFTVKGQFAEARGAAKLVFGNYKFLLKGALLRIVVELSQHSKLVHKLVVWAYNYWRARAKAVTHTDQQEYQKLAKYLEFESLA